MRPTRSAAIAVLLWIVACAMNPTPSVSAPAPAASPSAASKPAAVDAPKQTGADYARYLSAYWKRQADYYDAEGQYNRTFWQQRGRQAQLNADAFARQAQQDPVILTIVVFVVLSGVCLSIAQVAKGFIVPAKIATLAASPPRDHDPAIGDQVNTFKASMNGIEISSASIGLMMLTVSLAFFFLYLKFVYTITPVGS